MLGWRVYTSLHARAVSAHECVCVAAVAGLGAGGGCVCNANKQHHTMRVGYTTAKRLTVRCRANMHNARAYAYPTSPNPRIHVRSLASRLHMRALTPWHRSNSTLVTLELVQVRTTCIYYLSN